MTNRVNKRIEEYYDDTQILYNIFWSKALHYGFRDKGTKKLSDAIENTNRFVSKLLNLQENDYALDAGCGVGGSSFFMAKNFDVKIIGISLSSKQIKQARKDAKKLHLDNLASFEIMDFNNTKFKDETFTKIFSIEGACYAYNKLDFLREAYRLLTTGGKIVIVDGFLIKKSLSEKEREIYNKCLLGWKGDNLSLRDDFLNDLRRVGFKNIKFYDKTDEVMTSSGRMALYGYLFFPVTFILSKLKLISKNIYEHTVACINQKKALHSFTIYGVFYAEK
jgi:SAM-dependent methyltransferase